MKLETSEWGWHRMWQNLWFLWSPVDQHPAMRNKISGLKDLVRKASTLSVSHPGGGGGGFVSVKENLVLISFFTKLCFCFGKRRRWVVRFFFSVNSNAYFLAAVVTQFLIFFYFTLLVFCLIVQNVHFSSQFVSTMSVNSGNLRGLSFTCCTLPTF